MTYNDRLTCEATDGSHYWSNRKKDELIERLGEYEDIGLSPAEISVFIALISDESVSFDPIKWLDVHRRK